MDKRSFKKHSIKEQDSAFREKYNILDEKYTRIKEILKQVLTELRELKLEKQRLTAEQEKLVAEIGEKDELLERMQSVSEAVVDEYTALKLKCDLETEAANNAIKRATKYFQENQKLKRNTGSESKPDIAGKDTNEIPSQESLLDENTSELEVLNNLASELRTEIANLNIQLSKEIEKQNSLKDDFEIAKSLYEEEMKDHNYTKEKLQNLQLIHSNYKLQDSDSKNYHCNSFQSNQVNDSNTAKCNSVEHDDAENYDNISTKLESAEAQAASYKQENEKLLCKIQELESQIRKLNKEVCASDLLPIPPPPPPPPLPPPSFNPIKSLITFIHAGKKSSKTEKKENSENPQQKAMSEMIDAIKKGNIQLKPTPKSVPLSPKKEVQETALGEMKNMLASLKKKNFPCEDTKAAELRNIYERSSVDFSSQETDKSFNIGSDIDDELKFLLRKQSIKITTNKESDDGSNADSLPVMINDDEEEIGKGLEMPLQGTDTLDKNQFVSIVFRDNSHLCSGNEENLDITTQEFVTSDENWSTDSVLSDKSIRPEKEKCPDIQLQESTTSDEIKLADSLLSNNSKMSIESEKSLEMPLKKLNTENQLDDSVFLDSKMSFENEESHEMESATENQLADDVFPLNSRVSNVYEKSSEIPLQESVTGNHPVHLLIDNNTNGSENEKSLEIPFQESTTENKSADHPNERKGADNGKCVENILENEKSLEIPFQESTTENQSGDHPDNRKGADNGRGVGNILQESVTESQSASNVFSDENRKSDENEKYIEILLQESTTSSEMQLKGSFLSENSKLSSENETIII